MTPEDTELCARLEELDSTVADAAQSRIRELAQANAFLCEQLKKEQAENARMREALERISKQRPEKPDYWSSCGQCYRNIEDAAEALTPATP